MRSNSFFNFINFELIIFFLKISFLKLNINDLIIKDWTFAEGFEVIIFETSNKMISEAFNKVMFEVFDRVIPKASDRIMPKAFDKIVFEAFDKIMFETFDKIIGEDKVINVKIIETVVVFDFLKLFIEALMCSKYFVKAQIRLLISNSSNSLL